MSEWYSLSLVMDSFQRQTATGAPTLDAAQAAGFPVGGEPLAIDLADTIVLVPENADLLTDRSACGQFWALQADRLPAGWRTPTLGATRELRDAIRQLLDACREGRPYSEAALRTVNAASAAVSASLHVDVRRGEPTLNQHWHAADGTRLALGAAAQSLINILTDPGQRSRLRQCANPECSMLFALGDSRRRWCTPNICGNRVRVARHYRRHRGEAIG